MARFNISSPWLLTLQNRVSEQDARVLESVNAIEQAREEIVRHLFVRDSPALWSSQFAVQCIPKSHAPGATVIGRAVERAVRLFDAAMRGTILPIPLLDNSFCIRDAIVERNNCWLQLQNHPQAKS